MTRARHLLGYLLGGVLPLLMLLIPVAAVAQTLNPAGYSGWNLYVYGNGEVIAEILENIRRMIAPDHGGGAFRALLLFVSLGGFLFIVLQTVSDPGRHMLRLFTYILLVWAVVMFGSRLNANVIVVDKLTGRHYVVSQAPAIVAIPASVTSEFGRWMTEQIEMNYAYPDLTVSQAPGGYSLLTRLLDDSAKFTLTNAELRRSLGAFSTDCVVPAIARGDLRGHELTTSENLLETLKKAQHNAIMTVYYKTDAASGEAPACAGPSAGVHEGSLGAVMSCAAAYQCIRNDVIEHAQELLDAKARQWEGSGVLLPYEQAMSTALQFTGAPGGVLFAGRTRSHGFILQRAMVDTMRGSFRTAAMQTGNNELLSAVAVRQAEQMQRSTWWTASELFKVLMPYIYTVLQLFIFAIAPVIVVTLLIPGLGRSIITNYAQILVWLTLWMPLLAVVNFIILAIAKHDLGALMPQGVTMNNQYVVDETTNNLMMAANYLGTLVPLITWGLVKGTLAFTEFIQAGIGSSFAAQAGSTASTGNLSLGNISMDNTSANKFSIAAASEIGDKGVTAYMGAGSLLSKVDGGGASTTFNNVAAQRNVQESLQHAINANMTQALSERFGMQNVYNELRNRGLDEATARRLSESFKRDVTDRLSNRTFSSEEHARSEAHRLAKEWAQKEEAQHAANARQHTSASAGVGLNFGVGPKAEMVTGASNEMGSAHTDSVNAGKSGGSTIEGQHRQTGGTDASRDNATTLGLSNDDDRSRTTTITAQQLRSHLESFTSDVTAEVGTMYQESYQRAASSTMSIGMALTGSEYMRMADSAAARDGHVGASIGSAQDKVGAGRSALARQHADAGARQEQWDKDLRGAAQALRQAPRPQTPKSPDRAPNVAGSQEAVQLIKEAEQFGREGAQAALVQYRNMKGDPAHPLGGQIPIHRS